MFNCIKQSVIRIVVIINKAIYLCIVSKEIDSLFLIFSIWSEMRGVVPRDPELILITDRCLHSDEIIPVSEGLDVAWLRLTA
jgi:hypothetical protein